MNLAFLSPLYLLGLLGVAAPVLMHLLTRRQQTRVKFSAVYLLLQSQKRSIKRSRPNRLLLLALRCLAIAFFSLALANPIFSLGKGEDLFASAPASNVIVMDDSYSMGARSKTASLHGEAVSALTTTIKKMPDNSEFSLVFASAPSRIAQGWTSDRDVVLNLLKVSQPSYATTQIGKAVTQAVELLGTSSKKIKRIFILTDLQKNGWDKEDFPENAAGARDYDVRVADFSGLRDGENRAAVENLDVAQEFLSTSRTLRVKTRVRSLAPGKPADRLSISLWIDGKKQGEGFVNLPPGGAAEKEFSLPYLGSDPAEGRVEIQDDALPADNVRHFFDQPDQKIKTLIVDGDPRTVAHQSETFYLERALNPFSSSLSDIDLTISTLAELPRYNLLNFSAVALCNVRALPLQYERELEAFVLRGGALFISLGDQVDPKFYNEKLGNLLPVRIESLNQVGLEDSPFRLKLQPSEHPVLKIFSLNTLKEMENIRFNSLYSVEPREGRKFDVPMRFENGYPAAVEANVGKGKTVLFVSSIDRDWNDFPIQPTFVPWIQRWVKYSARSLESIARQDILVGEPFVWENAGEGGYAQSPGGKISPLNKNSMGEVRFEDTMRPGTYRLYRASAMTSGKAPGPPPQAVFQLPPGAEPAGGFTVNIDTRESAPEKIGEKEIKDRLAGMRVAVAAPPIVEETASPGKNFPLTAPLFLLVALMFFCEGWLVRRE
ncbi:MAG: BatA domain-containing protein [Nitrospinae bacterium]|nr:BatA domain-containing protein [Nitrospinota bacterium]